MNSAAEAQVLRRGVVPKIQAHPTKDTWLEAQMAKWIAKMTGPTFEPFDMFDQSSADHIKALAKDDVGKFTKYYQSFSVPKQNSKPEMDHVQREKVFGAGAKLTENETTALRNAVYAYLNATNTSQNALSRGCGKHVKYITMMLNAEYKCSLQITHDLIVKTMALGIHGFEANGAARLYPTGENQ